MKTFKTMFQTELKLSLRGMDMLLFAVFMPLTVMALLGMVYGSRPAFDGAGYTFLEQSFGALTTISICAGGVMGLPLVVSDYRDKKILKHFQVTPVSPMMILSVQLTVYALYSLASLILLYLAGAIFFGCQLKGSVLLFTGSYLLVMLSMFSLGLMAGGIAPNPKAASVIACILYFPMLIFSGATLPYEIMPAAFARAADVLPLTQGIKLLKAASLGLPVDKIIMPIILLLALTVVCTGISLKFFRWE